MPKFYRDATTPRRSPPPPRDPSRLDARDLPASQSGFFPPRSDLPAAISGRWPRRDEDPGRRFIAAVDRQTNRTG